MVLDPDFLELDVSIFFVDLFLGCVHGSVLIKPDTISTVDFISLSVGILLGRPARSYVH